MILSMSTNYYPSTSGASHSTVSKAKKKQKQISAVPYLIASAFFLVFFLIYDQFSHGVRSPYMTFLFAWPLLLGVVPVLLVNIIHALPKPGYATRAIWRAAVSTCTMSSLLRGVFEIAGTSSPLQTFLMILGIAELGTALLWYVIETRSRSVPNASAERRQ